MATFTKFQDFAEQVLKGVHNFSSNTLKLALSNTAPLATNTVLADITQITAGGGYVAGGYVLDSVVLTETGGTAKVTIADETILATGGSIPTFRYLVIYNDTPAGDPLIGWYDYGSALSLANGESLTVDFDGTNGVFTLT